MQTHPLDSPDVAGFIAFPRTMRERDWADLGELVGVGGEFSLRNFDAAPPPGFSVVRRLEVVQPRLVSSVGAVIRARGETPFLHALSTNTTAIDLYLQLGFRLRQRPTVTVLRHDG